MQKKVMSWKTKGMNQDLSVSAFNPEFSFENINLRLSTNDGNTMLSWVNEKGPKKMNIVISTKPWASSSPVAYYILGKTIGTAVINHQLVLFTTTSPQKYTKPDSIYVLQLNSDKTALTGKVIYNGNLNFNPVYPIETLTSYEAEHIQKVYWTDGFNQPRIINIAASDSKLEKWNATTDGSQDYFFDFVPSMQYGETVTITKNPSSGGIFAPGVIQYAFTYINKYSQQSNIAYISPIYYLTYTDRGASQEDKVNCSFHISIANADKHFDYIRLYSIQRTSIDLEPIVKHLDDIPIGGTTREDLFSAELIHTKEARYNTTFTLPRDNEGKILGAKFTNGNVTFYDEQQTCTIDVISGTSSTGYIARNVDSGNCLYNFVAYDDNDSDILCSFQYFIDLIYNNPKFRGDYIVTTYYTAIRFGSNTDELMHKLLEEYNASEGTSFENWGFSIKPYNQSFVNFEDSTILNTEGGFYLVYSHVDDNHWFVVDGGGYNELSPGITKAETGSDSTTEYIDNGTTGAIVDPSELLYAGGKEITALTMADKDGTLFLGNFKQNIPLIDDLQRYFDSQRNENNWGPTFNYDENGSTLKTLNVDPVSGIYSYTNLMRDYNQRQMSTFKGGEWYRLGFQLQTQAGEWTEPIFIKDVQNNKYPDTSVYSDAIKLPYASMNIALNNITFNNSDFSWKKFKRARPVIVYPSLGDRTVLCQGVLNPTVFNVVDRQDNSPFAQASWYFRPYLYGSTSQAAISENPDSSVTVTNITSSTDPWSAGITDTTFFDRNGFTQTVYILIAQITNDCLRNITRNGYLQIQEETVTGGGEDNSNNGGLIDPTASNRRKARSTKIEEGSGNTTIKKYTHSFFGYIYLEQEGSTPPIYALFSDEVWKRPLVEYRDNVNENVTTTVITYIDEGLLIRNPQSMIEAGYSFISLEGGRHNSKTKHLFYSKIANTYNGETVPGSFTFQFGYENNYYRAVFSHFTLTNYLEKKEGSIIPFTHYDSLEEASQVVGSDNNEKATTFEIMSSVNMFDAWNSEDINIQNGKAIRSNTQFFIDQSIVTLNSPDLEFDTAVQAYGTDGLKLRVVGAIPLTADTSAHKIETSTNMLETNYNNESDGNSLLYGVGEIGTNVIHVNRSINAGKHLVSDYLWNDSVVSLKKDSKEIITESDTKDYLIYPWHKNGSLNNDWRSANDASSVLGTKKESNLLYSAETEYFQPHNVTVTGSVNYNVWTQFALQENDEVFNLRLGMQTTSENTSSEINYYPNIDKVLHNENGVQVITSKDTKYELDGRKAKEVIEESSTTAASVISMKYKSGTHAVLALRNTSGDDIPILPFAKYTGGSGVNSYSGPSAGKYTNPAELSDRKPFWDRDKTMSFSQAEVNTLNLFNNLSTHKTHNFLWLGELYKDVENRFGGDSREAVRHNKWQIAGDTVDISDNTSNIILKWTTGDTYYQRYDCLKTYAYTKEDRNQLVEILSFMCETHMNIDGRYDRNRGQKVSYNMHPTRFNLWNPVYSQSDNFFSSRKMDTEDVDSLYYPNYAYYTKTKNPGADVDQWTNITLGSTLEFDGDKGKVSSLMRFNDQLIAFQDTGISQILYNENMQMSTTQGVPIEIANSGKVNGKRYLSSSVGCSNKWSIADTPNGIYFMDNHNKAIYLFNGQLQNISLSFGFNSWSKKNIPSPDEIWNPDAFNSFVTYYDRQNQDVLFINKDTALAFSEKFNTFTSFYDYGQSQYLCNLDDESIWIRNKEGKFFDAMVGSTIEPATSDPNSLIGHGSPFSGQSAPAISPSVPIVNTSVASSSNLSNLNQAEFIGTHSNLFLHNKGSYGVFFGEDKPFSMTLVGNPEPQLDKVFTNLEFRACVSQDVDTQHGNVFWRPFNTLETWNEYQHGIAELKNMSGHVAMLHHRTDTNDASLKRKFRIWRCDIPRDNAPLDTDAELGVSRLSAHPLDRMRNPWLYLKLVNEELKGQAKIEIHDIAMTYYE